MQYRRCSTEVVPALRRSHLIISKVEAGERGCQLRSEIMMDGDYTHCFFGCRLVVLRMVGWLVFVRLGGEFRQPIHLILSHLQ